MAESKTVDSRFFWYSILGVFLGATLIFAGIFAMRNTSDSASSTLKSEAADTALTNDITTSSSSQDTSNAEVDKFTTPTTVTPLKNTSPTDESESTAVEKPDSSDTTKKEGSSAAPKPPTVTAQPSNGKPVVHLTFDDGPTELTPYLLDILDKHNAKATFFMLGSELDANPKIGQQVVARGHAIGNHSYTHGDWREPGAKADMIKAQETIERNLGVSPSCARSPFGAFNDQVTAELSSLGMKRWRWDLDPKEWGAGKEDRFRAMLEQIPSATKVEGAEGVIILQHDSHESLQVLIDMLDASLTTNGDKYQFKVIDGCLNYQ